MEPSNQPSRIEAGFVVGGYELVRRLGRGGMAEVWVARRALGQKSSKIVAIKLIADHYVGDERYARMFRAEAELAAILSHANIVQVFDEGEDDGRSFIVMEWVDGLNLLKLGAVLALLDDEERRFRVTAYIIGQLLYALGYAHSITSYDGSPLGVVHRDVSPQNVMVSNHGEVKLTDFGVAYQVMEESSGIHVKGKVRYMSPEQLSGKTRSATVDLFAVGALLHELLDGKKFRSEYDDGQEMFTAVLSGEIPPMSRPVPPELDELRLRLLEPDPAQRIQSAEEALDWLQRYPSYGDARGELTQLCGSLTGVLRPRAGPGHSSQGPIDRRAAHHRNPKGLARPKINPEPRPAPPDAKGQTELVRSQQPSTPGRKQVFSAPSAGVAIPPPVQRQPSHPIPVPAPPPSSHPGPSYVPPRSSSPIQYTVAEQPSHPIQVHAEPRPGPGASLPPTERLGRSEISGPSSAPFATDIIDASMLIEEVSASGTDQSFQPQVALREGTDTSREIRPQPPGQSIRITLPRGSALAALGVGLVLVAAMSIAATMWIFERNRDEVRTARSERDVATPALEAALEEPAAAPLALPRPVEPVDALGPVEAAPEPTPSAVLDDELVPEEQVLEEQVPTDAQPVPDDQVVLDAQPVELEDADEPPPELAGEAAPDVEPEATPEPLAEPKKVPKAKAVVIVKALFGMPDAQIRLGSRELDMPASRKLTTKLFPGTTKVAWRISASAPWKPSTSLSLRGGKTTTLLLTATGLTEI